MEISFPPKCSQQHIQVATNTFLPLKNDVCPGAHIVSAVYQFNCNVKRFDKAFTLRLQHCIELQSSEDCQKMRFIVHHDGNNDVKYGHFEAGKSYGTVVLHRFCSVFIIWIPEPWKNIRIVVLPLSGNEDDSFQQVSSNQLSISNLEANSDGLSASQTDHRGNSQSARSQQHDSSELAPSSTMAPNSPVYEYESMIGLPKDHCHLTEWSGVYSIYVNLGEWRKVCG